LEALRGEPGRALERLRERRLLLDREARLVGERGAGGEDREGAGGEEDRLHSRGWRIEVGGSEGSRDGFRRRGTQAITRRRCIRRREAGTGKTRGARPEGPFPAPPAPHPHGRGGPRHPIPRVRTAGRAGGSAGEDLRQSWPI